MIWTAGDESKLGQDIQLLKSAETQTNATGLLSDEDAIEEAVERDIKLYANSDRF